MLQERKMSDISTRRALLTLMTSAVAALLAAPAVSQALAITVHKDPNCGCCTGWARHLRSAGFQVTIIESQDVEAVKARLKVPGDLASCHTAEISGYAIEGHVPASAVKRMLAERPQAIGLAVPGMPVGSPGMEGGAPVPYDVVLFGADGRRRFMRFSGIREVS
jgi:hypothetical protein